MDIAAIVLDIAAVAIVIYCAHAAARKGFLRTVIQMVAYVAIILAASFFSRAAAPVVYDRVVEPMITQRQEAPREPGGADLISYGRAGLLSALDDGLGALESGLDSVKELLPDEFDPQALADGLVDELADATLRPLMISAIGMIGFVLLFSILSIVANILLSTLGIVNHLPVVGPINALLGGAVGILEGLLLVWVFAFLLRGLLGIYPEGWWIFRADTIGHTFLFRYFADPTLLGQLA